MKTSINLNEDDLVVLRWVKEICGEKMTTSGVIKIALKHLVSSLCNEENTILDYYNNLFDSNADGRKKNGRPKNSVEDNTVPFTPPSV